MSTRAFVFAVCFLTWQTVAAHRFAETWRSDLTLWADAVQHAPGRARAHLNYAKALYLTGDDTAMRREADLGQRLAERPQR